MLLPHLAPFQSLYRHHLGKSPANLPCQILHKYFNTKIRRRKEKFRIQIMIKGQTVDNDEADQAPLGQPQ